MAVADVTGMKTLLFALLLSATSLAAWGVTPFTALHPEEALPDPVAPVSQGPHSELIGRVQEQLNALGFAAGPVNGDWNEKTQAALAQFQLSRTIPAGGQLDGLTLSELGVVLEGT
jgi:peptidoglycan hydrolase-like protein with peptidoglycan-binding domain